MQTLVKIIMKMHRALHKGSSDGFAQTLPSVFFHAALPTPESVSEDRRRHLSRLKHAKRLT